MARLSALGMLTLFSFSGLIRADESPETFFELKIRPVLVSDCLPCHGGKKTSGGLRVDSREALIKGGDRGAAVVAGDPQGSLLIQAIRRTHDEVKMPPKGRLSDDAVNAFAKWVADGAVWPSSRGLPDRSPGTPSTHHWAFESINAVEPLPDPTGWSERPVDRFISSKRREAGLRPVRRGDKGVLLRRVTFDLIGLPPTPEEAADFLGDSGPDAFEGVVDRLLASPHYGERWGRHWMDVAHYADTAGDNADYPVPELASYRDYIIDAFNRDKPYDRFVREQLAGDILARKASGEDYAGSVVATGFLALSRRYGTGPYELWHLTLEDAIEDDRTRLPGIDAPLCAMPRP